MLVAKKMLNNEYCITIENVTLYHVTTGEQETVDHVTNWNMVDPSEINHVLEKTRSSSVCPMILSGMVIVEVIRSLQQWWI